jgi:hypothetical protein
LSESAGQLNATAMNDSDLISIGDEIGNGFAGRVKNLFVFKGDSA